MFDIVVTTDKGKSSETVRCNINHCTIGKSRDNLIQIRGWRVANIHAELEHRKRTVYHR